MSMTKRYLESLPQAEQDDILGLPQDDEWDEWDEWDESAENEPTDWPDDDVYRGEGDLEC